jgi:hypothetical protein
LDALYLYLNSIEYLHKDTLKNNLKLTYINLGDNQLTMLHHQMFSHLDLEWLHLKNNVCINQVFHYSMNQIEKIEDSLRVCSTGFGVYNRIAKDFGKI